LLTFFIRKQTRDYTKIVKGFLQEMFFFSNSWFMIMIFRTFKSPLNHIKTNFNAKTKNMASIEEVHSSTDKE